MPLYEYQCDACGHRFEVIQKFSDPPLEKCPKCGSAVHKLQSAPAFHLKGSGWYATDYAKKDTSSAGGESKPAASDKPASTETKDSPKTDTTAPASTATPAASTTTKAS